MPQEDLTTVGDLTAGRKEASKKNPGPSTFDRQREWLVNAVRENRITQQQFVEASMKLIEEEKGTPFAFDIGSYFKRTGTFYKQAAVGLAKYFSTSYSEAAKQTQTEKLLNTIEAVAHTATLIYAPIIALGNAAGENTQDVLQEKVGMDTDSAALVGFLTDVGVNLVVPGAILARARTAAKAARAVTRIEKPLPKVVGELSEGAVLRVKGQGIVEKLTGETGGLERASVLTAEQAQAQLAMKATAGAGSEIAAATAKRTTAKQANIEETVKKILAEPLPERGVAPGAEKGSEFALKLKDGTVIHEAGAANHFVLASDKKINPSDIEATGYFISGEFKPSGLAPSQVAADLTGETLGSAKEKLIKSFLGASDENLASIAEGSKSTLERMVAKEILTARQDPILAAKSLSLERSMKLSTFEKSLINMPIEDLAKLANSAKPEAVVATRIINEYRIDDYLAKYGEVPKGFTMPKVGPRGGAPTNDEMFDRLHRSMAEADHLIDLQRGPRPRTQEMVRTEAAAKTGAVGPFDIHEFEQMQSHVPLPDLDETRAADALRPIIERIISTARNGVQTNNFSQAPQLIADLYAVSRAVPGYEGMRTAAGDSLRALKDPVLTVSQSMEDMRHFYSWLEKFGVADMNELMTVSKSVFYKLSRYKTPDEAVDFVREASKTRTLFQKPWSALADVYINSLISGPITQARNVIGNAAAVALEMIELGTSAALTKFGPKRFRDRPDAIMPTDAKEFWNGFKVGMTDAWSTFLDQGLPGLEGLAKEAGFRGHGKVETAEIFSGTLGTILHMPTTMLTVVDSFFRSGVYKGELYRQAQQVARAKSIPVGTTAWREEIERFVQNPDPVTMKIAREKADLLTFTNDPFKGAQRLSQLANDYPALRLIFPFVRTPADLITYSWERSPVLALLSKNMKTAIEGYSTGDPEAVRAVSRMLTSTMMIAPLWLMAENGYLTGAGPADKELGRTWERSGVIDSSFTVNVFGRKINYQNYMPISPMLGLIATAHDLMKYHDVHPEKISELLMGLVLSVAENFNDQAFIPALNDFFKALGDPNAEYWRLAADVVPGLVPFSGFLRQLERAGPVVGLPRGSMLETLNFADLLTQSIPFYASTKLSPVYDMFGDPVPHRAYFVYEDHPHKNDPIVGMLERLGMYPPLSPKVLSGRPPAKFRIFTRHQIEGEVAEPEDIAVPLTHDEISEYERIKTRELRDTNGDLYHEALNKIATDPEVLRQSDEEQRAIVRTTANAFDAMTKAEMIERSPSLRQRFEKAQQLKALLRTPPEERDQVRSELEAGAREGPTPRFSVPNISQHEVEFQPLGGSPIETGPLTTEIQP